MKKKVSQGIYKIGNGVFQFSWYVKGKRRWETIHINSIKEARDIRNQRILDSKKASGDPLINKDANFETIWTDIKSHCETVGNTTKTIGEYGRRYWRLFKVFPIAKGITMNNPTELTVPYLNQYLNWYVNENKAKENPASEARTIKIIFGKLLKLGYLTKSKYDEIIGFVKLRPNADDHYPHISNTELLKLFNYMKNDSLAYHDFFMFLMLTGRRPMETAQILKSSIEWEGLNKPLRINIVPKTAKNRRKDQIELHKEKDSHLKATICNAFNRSNLLKSSFLFCNKHGKKISATDQERYIKKVSELVLGIKISAKYFRKRYATVCLQNRVPIKDAMARSGHKDVDVFVRHYQQPTQEGIEKVSQAVGFEGEV